MTEQGRGPSISRFLAVDYWAFVAIISMAIVWLIFLYDAYVDGSRDTSFISISTITTIVAAVVLQVRYSRISRLWESRNQVSAIVQSTGFFRGRGIITYIFTFRGQKYINRDIILKTSRTRAYRVGDHVTALVDSDSPKQSIISDLYT